MASGETKIVHDIILGCGAKLFKNVRGTFFTRDGRPIKAGLGANGASDLIGFKTVTITPDMVGRDVAIFCAIEVKTETGQVKKEQHMFIEAVQKNGGIAGVARNLEDAKKLLTVR